MRLRVWWWWGVAAQVACGRIAFEPVIVDGHVDEIATGPFGAPQPFAHNTLDNEDDPAITADGLELCFDTNRPGGPGLNDIWCTRRASRSSPWPPPALVVELSSAAEDLSPGFSADALTLYLSRPNGPSGLELHVATRPDRSSPWSAPQLIAELVVDGDDANAQPSADHLELWYAAKHGTDAQRQLYRATRATSSSAWSASVAVDGLNVSANIYTGDPWLSHDGSAIYFTSDRAGTTGLKDIWRATRPSPATFGVAETIVEINGPDGDQDPCLTADERTIVFASRRGAGTDLDVYIAER